MQNDEQANTERTKVGFPDASESQKSGNGKVIFLVVIILLILGGASWYLLSRKEETIEFTNDSITPAIVIETPTPEEVMEEKSVDKKDLKIQIQNGTGTPGDAGKLEKALNELSYSEISTGNADNYDYVAAEATFGSDFPENYKTEITDKLKSMYSSVEEGDASLGAYDAIIITGKAATSSFKVSATVTPTPTEKPTATPTP